MVRDNNENFDESNEPRVNIVSQIISTIFFLASIYTVYRVAASNKLSMIYIVLITAALVVINFILGLVAFRRKTTKMTLAILNIMSVILMAGMIFSAIVFCDNKVEVADEIINDDDASYIVYNIITSSKSIIDEPRELDGKELFVYDEPEKKIDNNDLENAVKNVVSDTTLTFKSNIETIINRTTKLINSASIIKSDTYEKYISDKPELSEQIKIVKKIKIKSKDTL